jgi:S-methylmethionine-dependent homocysteine/selenocysteine methylase
MTDDRAVFPSSDRTIFLTDGGLETTLLFLRGIDLPCFAAFPLLLDEGGRRELASYFEPYIRTARERRVGFILDTPTWRANPDWGAKLGYSAQAIADINRQAVAWAKAFRDEHAEGGAPIVVNGAIGPRGDGYRPGDLMTAEQAQDYHATQVNAFRDAGADMVTAVTMNYAEEAIGAANAARAAGIPVVISFTVETDGRLASGETLQSAIERTDRETGSAPLYYMINCAHPTHFESALAGNEAWIRRIGGVRANASPKSHAELDEALELDSGDPIDLGRRYRGLRDRFHNVSVLGGCCGTDHRHIVAICDACLPA